MMPTMQTIDMLLIIFGAIMSALVMVRMATKPTNFVLNLLVVLATLECTLLSHTPLTIWVFMILLVYNFYKLVHGEYLREA